MKFVASGHNLYIFLVSILLLIASFNKYLFIYFIADVLEICVSFCQGLVSHPTMQEIAKIARSLNLGLSAIKTAVITQLSRTGIIVLKIYVSCQ